MNEKQFIEENGGPGCAYLDKNVEITQGLQIGRGEPYWMLIQLEPRKTLRTGSFDEIWNAFTEGYCNV